MNRRDLLKKLAAAPVAAVVAPLAIASDGVALNSAAHPTMEGDFDTANLRYERYEWHNIETVELELPTHEWHCGRDVCIHCGVTQTYVEDHPSELTCWTRVAARRKQALVDSFNQSWAEAFSKGGVW